MFSKKVRENDLIEDCILHSQSRAATNRKQLLKSHLEGSNVKRQVFSEEKAKLNPQFDAAVVQIEVFHKDYNLEHKDNLDELPQQPAVFGLFGIIHETAVHPRYIASTDNLQRNVKALFRNPGSKGLKSFVQGPWVKRLCYELMPGSTFEERKQKETDWIMQYEPQVTDQGDYPDYRYVWPYDAVDE